MKVSAVTQAVSGNGAAKPFVARWRKVAVGIRELMHQQGLTGGERLPTEAVLCRNFEISRFTVRQALAELERNGLVRLQHGQGAYVAEDNFPYLLCSRTRYSENLRRVGVEPGRTIRASFIEPADAYTCKQLDIPRGADVLVIQNVSEADGLPLTVGENRYPLPRFIGLDDAVRVDGSFTGGLHRFGVKEYRRLRTYVGARLPTIEEARLLRISQTRPVISVEAIDVDESGVPIRVGIGVFHAGRTHLLIEGDPSVG